jgi:hypothetical protein
LSEAKSGTTVNAATQPPGFASAQSGLQVKDRKLARGAPVVDGGAEVQAMVPPLPNLRSALHFANLFLSERVDGAAARFMQLWTPVPPQPEKRSMRISASIPLTFATMTLAASAAMAPRPAAAAYNLPWCANYYENNVTSCAFTSYAQCFATVAGPVGGHCTLNPAYPVHPPYVERHRKSRPDRYSGVR